MSCSRSPTRVIEQPTKTSPRSDSSSDASIDIPTPPPGVAMQMHRKLAGVPDESGWCYAKSTEGDFSVSLPNVFNDFTITAAAEDGAEIKTFNLGTNDKRLVRFSAVAIFRPDAKFKGDRLEGFGEAFKKHGATVDKSNLVQAGMNGIELRVADPDGPACIRTFVSPTTQYVLTVEARTSLPLAELEPDAKRFFDSFRLTNSPK
jgi:hypothetical protein